MYFMRSLPIQAARVDSAFVAGVHKTLNAAAGCIVMYSRTSIESPRRRRHSPHHTYGASKSVLHLQLRSLMPCIYLDLAPVALAIPLPKSDS